MDGKAKSGTVAAEEAKMCRGARGGERAGPPAIGYWGSILFRRKALSELEVPLPNAAQLDRTLGPRSADGDLSEWDQWECLVLQSKTGRYGFSKAWRFSKETALQAAQRKTYEDTGLMPHQWKMTGSIATEFRDAIDLEALVFDVENNLPIMGSTVALATGYFIGVVKEEETLVWDRDEFNLVAWFPVAKALCTSMMQTNSKQTIRTAIKLLTQKSPT